MNKGNFEKEILKDQLEIDEYGRHRITDPVLLSNIVGGVGMAEIMPETVSNGACVNASCSL